MSETPPEDRKIQQEGGTAHGQQGGKVISDFLNPDSDLRVEDKDPQSGITSSMQIDRLPTHNARKPDEN